MKKQDIYKPQAQLAETLKETCIKHGLFCPQITQLFLKVDEIVDKYGLYGSLLYYEPSPISDSDRNRLYIVAGIDPVFSLDSSNNGIRPDEIFRQLERNKDLFYPNCFAFDLSECSDGMQAIENLVDYCKKAEFISRLYAEYELLPPEKLRLSEVNQLIHYRDTLNNPSAGSAMRKKCRQDLNWFFKREKSTGLRRQWLEYFRSEKFPKDRGALKKLSAFLHRGNNQVSFDQISDGTEDICKLELQEFEYKIFKKYIQECYPEVVYAVGDKKVVDHGLIGRSPYKEGGLEKAVTAEEYAVVRKNHFAGEGWSSVSNLRPAYWEFRNIYYKEADEPLIASVYNSIVLQYAKCNSLAELKSRGKLLLQKVPASDFMNFVSLAKANQLRFYIDNIGDYALPSLETINVLYNEHQEEKMSGIINRMIEDKVEYSHVLEERLNPPLNSMISQSKVLHGEGRNIRKSSRSDYPGIE